MNIGIIGAGNIGIGLGKRLSSNGHSIIVSFSKSPESLTAATTAIGGGARSGTVEEAARFGEVVVLATPWLATEMAIEQSHGALHGKTLWDCTNPLKPDFSGLIVGHDTSGGEQVARWAAGATVVKAIPPFAEILHQATLPPTERRPSVFVCSDTADARVRVAGLVSEIGADPVDAGPLALARYTEPMGALLVQLAYASGMGPLIGARLMRR
jgi:hypothetical protein